MSGWVTCDQCTQTRKCNAMGGGGGGVGHGYRDMGHGAGAENLLFAVNEAMVKDPHLPKVARRGPPRNVEPCPGSLNCSFMFSILDLFTTIEDTPTVGLSVFLHDTYLWYTFIH